MSDLKLSGRISFIGSVAQISEKFCKRDFAIEVPHQSNSGETYTQLAAFQVVNKSCPILDNFKEGQEVTVSFNVRSNMSEKDGVKRLFTNLTAWRIEHLQAQQTQQASQPVQARAAQPQSIPPAPQPEDDLPF